MAGAQVWCHILFERSGPLWSTPAAAYWNASIADSWHRKTGCSNRDTILSLCWIQWVVQRFSICTILTGLALPISHIAKCYKNSFVGKRIGSLLATPLLSPRILYFTWINTNTRIYDRCPLGHLDDKQGIGQIEKCMFFRIFLFKFNSFTNIFRGSANLIVAKRKYMLYPQWQTRQIFQH